MKLKKWWDQWWWSCQVWTWIQGDTFGTERWDDEWSTSRAGLTADRYATQPAPLIVCVCVGLQWPFKWISRVPVSGREGVTPRPINVSTSLTLSTPSLCCPSPPSTTTTTTTPPFFFFRRKLNYANELWACKWVLLFHPALQAQHPFEDVLICV